MLVCVGCVGWFMALKAGSTLPNPGKWRTRWDSSACFQLWLICFLLCSDQDPDVAKEQDIAGEAKSAQSFQIFACTFSIFMWDLFRNWCIFMQERRRDAKIGRREFSVLAAKVAKNDTSSVSLEQLICQVPVSFQGLKLLQLINCSLFSSRFEADRQEPFWSCWRWWWSAKRYSSGDLLRFRCCSYCVRFCVPRGTWRQLAKILQVQVRKLPEPSRGRSLCCFQCHWFCAHWPRTSLSALFQFCFLHLMFLCS